MAKKIRFTLEMADGVQARSLEELTEHFQLDKVMEYARDGKLETWLRDRYHDDMADGIKAVDLADDKAAENICRILYIPAAFDQDGLYDLLDEGAQRIYLYGTKFEIPLQKKGITYVGLNNPSIIVHSKEEVNWEQSGIQILHCTLDESSQRNRKKQDCKKIYDQIQDTPRGKKLAFGELYAIAKALSKRPAGNRGKGDCV